MMGDDERERLNGVEASAFRVALGRFLTGVTVVTTRAADGRVAGITVSSFNTLSLDPPLVLWSISLSSPSLPIFREARRFAVNILAAEQQTLARQFAFGAPDKFAGVETRQGIGGVPLLAGAIAHLECDLVDLHPGGDHEILVGKLIRADAVADRPPLAYHRGRFGAFAPH